jgi:hypothetical protein
MSSKTVPLQVLHLSSAHIDSTKAMSIIDSLKFLTELIVGDVQNLFSGLFIQNLLTRTSKMNVFKIQNFSFNRHNKMAFIKLNNLSVSALNAAQLMSDFLVGCQIELNLTISDILFNLVILRNTR